MQIVNGSLYAVLFSTGLIKVGRGNHRASRIKAHGKRLACVGATIQQSTQAVCVGDYVQVESALITRCAGASKARQASEWFEGLSFADVSDWLAEEAETPRPHRDPRISKCLTLGNEQRIVWYFDEPWMADKARRLATLSLSLAEMSAQQQDDDMDALPHLDCFTVADCHAFAVDLVLDGNVAAHDVFNALVSRASEIVFIQENFQRRVYGETLHALTEVNARAAMDWRVSHPLLQVSAQPAHFTPALRANSANF
jgi:hypothetical protein